MNSVNDDNRPCGVPPHAQSSWREKYEYMNKLWLEQRAEIATLKAAVYNAKTEAAAAIEKAKAEAAAAIEKAKAEAAAALEKAKAEAAALEKNSLYLAEAAAVEKAMEAAVEKAAVEKAEVIEGQQINEEAVWRPTTAIMLAILAAVWLWFVVVKEGRTPLLLLPPYASDLVIVTD